MEDDFLKKIDGREDLLQMLSKDRLEVLKAYYEEEIRKKKEKIKELKNQLCF